MRTSGSPRAKYKARDFAARHRLGLQLAMNFFETQNDPGDGSFDKKPWWYVRDTESLAKLSHLIPHVDRSGDPSSAASTPTKSNKRKGSRKKDEL